MNKTTTKHGLFLISDLCGQCPGFWRMMVGAPGEVGRWMGEDKTQAAATTWDVKQGQIQD